MNYANRLSFLSFLVVSVFMMFPISAYAKTITTKFFEITVPERFTHIEGVEEEAEGFYEAATEGMPIMSGQIISGGSSFIIEFGIINSEQEFLKETKLYVEDLKSGEDAPTIEHGVHENTSLVISYYTLIKGQDADMIPFHIHSYLMLQKQSKFAASIIYIDTNSVEEGRAAIDDIYNQIKVSNDNLSNAN